MPPSAITIQILVCLIWALGHVGVKSVSDQISPAFHGGIRSFGATLLLILWIQWRRIPVWKRDGTLWLGLAAGTLFGIEFVLLFVGLNMTSAARGTLLLYSAPFFVAIGAHFFVPNDKLTKNKIIGLSLAFTGLILVFWERLAVPATASIKDWHTGIIGDLLCLGAASLWGATTVLVKATKLKHCPPEKNLFYQLAVSVPVLLIAALVMGEQGVTQYSTQLTAVIAFGVFVVASSSFLTWFWLISKYPATVLHAFTFLTPLFGVVLAALLLHESISAFLITGSILIAAGIVLVNRQ